MRLGVRGAWVIDNLKRLGIGAFYHLAYATHQVHPQVLARLRKGVAYQGRVDVFVVRDGRGVRIADGEIVAVHWYPEFLRIHFMIGRVYVDEPGEEVGWSDEACLVLPDRAGRAENKEPEPTGSGW